MHQTARLCFVEGEPVRARIDIDVRKARLDVLAHLDGALVQKRLAVVEEVDPLQRGAGFVDDAPEQLEVEHAGLARPRDAGFGGAHRLGAGDVAGRRALDIHPLATGPHPEIGLEGSSRLSGVFSEQSPQNFDPPAFRSSLSRVMVAPLHTS